MRSIFYTLLAGAFLTASTAFAQINLYGTDLISLGLKGRIESVVDISRSYSPQANRWEPIIVISTMHFNRQGRLLKKGIYARRYDPGKDIYVYDAEGDSALPIAGAAALTADSAENKPLQEYLYAYEDDGRVAGIIERDYSMGRVLNREYFYKWGKVGAIVAHDSATGTIVEIEQFFYQDDGKLAGSTIRQFDPKTDKVKELADTLKVPASRIARSYTSYVYSDTTTPVIFWRWNFGNDTIVDRQEIKRFLVNGALSAFTANEFKGGKETMLQSYVYNAYGDALSSAASFGNDTTFQRGFDYIYDKFDKNRNWTVRRQYTVGKTSTDEHLLLSRTDRRITYYEEEK